MSGSNFEYKLACECGWERRQRYADNEKNAMKNEIKRLCDETLKRWMTLSMG